MTVSQNDRGPGQLVVVATPLGNLGDISRRALEVLESADVVYCEDTRRSRTLVSAFSLSPKGRLVALHEHNEASLCAEVVERVRRGETVAVVTDAGTPGISDPGSRVVAAVADAGLTVTTAPGPSAVVAALSISALPTERFVMEGFFPRRAGERESRLDEWGRERRTIVFYEAPQRLVATLDELAGRFPKRRVTVVRELTKLHEEVVRGTAATVAAQFTGREVLGEIVVVLEGAPAEVVVDEATVTALLFERLSEGESVRDAVAAAVDLLGAAHRPTYELALRLRAGQES